MTGLRGTDGRCEVLVAGGGPAGAIAALVLARAGARVVLVDRSEFPRDKLCGDTLNPGAMAILHRQRLTVAEPGVPLTGMLVTGPAGARVEARYPGGCTGRAIRRRDLDAALLQAAAGAGVCVIQGTRVEAPLFDQRTGAVCGVVTRAGLGPRRNVGARLVIAADGRASRLARALSLARFPRSPRRWAIGAYFEGVADVRARGEMHLRRGHYIGVAPLPAGRVNVCVVTSDRQQLRRLPRLLRETLVADVLLGDRFAGARMVSKPSVLGPLAVEATAAGAPGLLLAGDAAGLIDPMTGDGLRFALRGGELAAIEALRSLASGDLAAHIRLAAVRQREFGAKWRFNRVLRMLSASAEAVRIAGLAVRVASWPVARMVRYAGDVPAA